MRIYEELFIVDPNATDEEIDAIVAQVEGIITEAGGTIDKVDRWGKRRLAYTVKKRDEGYYILVQFSSADAQMVRELERRLRVHEQVLKYLTVRIDEKLKWLEKKKKQREKRAKRRPQVAPPPPAAAKPQAPGAAIPGKPNPGQASEPKPSPEPESKPESKPEPKPEPEPSPKPEAEVTSEPTPVEESKPDNQGGE